jgi:hypothetical protein
VSALAPASTTARSGAAWLTTVASTESAQRSHDAQVARQRAAAGRVGLAVDHALVDAHATEREPIEVRELRGERLGVLLADADTMHPQVELDQDVDRQASAASRSSLAAPTIG